MYIIIVIYVVITVNYCKCILLYSPLNSYLYVHWILDVNKYYYNQFHVIEFVFGSVYVDMQYDEIYLTFTAVSVCLCGVGSHVVVIGL